MASDISTQASVEAFDLATNEILKDIKPSEIEIKMIAKDLVDYANKLTLDAQHQKRLAQGIGKSDNGEEVLSFSRKVVTKKENFKELMEKVFNLQNKINNFLGQQVQMVFTYIDKKTGEVIIYKVDNDVEHLAIDRASKSHGGTITGRYKYSRKALNEMQKLVNSTYNDSSLKTTFNEVYRRYKISKERIKGSAFYIFWKDNGVWDGAKVTSVGALGESYFAFWINEYIFSSMIETAVGDFITNPKYGVIQGDSVSGFLQGDVSKNGIEYGVKAQGATALGYVEIVNYAKEIMAAPDLLNFLTDETTGLKQRLIEQGSQNLAQYLDHNIDSSLEGILNDFSSDFNKK